MKNKTAQTPAQLAVKRAQHEAYLSAGHVMVIGLNGRLHRRMVRRGQQNQS